MIPIKKRLRQRRSPYTSYILRKAIRQITGRQALAGRPAQRPLAIGAMAGAGFAVAWLGHASLLLRVDGMWVLVDPVLRPTIGPLPGLGPARITAPALEVHALPPIDLILLSHDHFDHLDLPTLRAIVARQPAPPRLLAGKGVERLLDRSLRRHVETLTWWETRTIGPLTVTFTPAQHGSGRSITGKNRTLWGGWYLASPSGRLYFAGDTADAPGLFEAIRDALGAPDLAAIPVGAYAPRRWMRFEHLDPGEAIAVFHRLRARSAVGVHWGTFNLGEETPADTREAFATAQARHPADGFRLWSIGEWQALRNGDAEAADGHDPVEPWSENP